MGFRPNSGFMPQTNQKRDIFARYWEAVPGLAAGNFPRFGRPGGVTQAALISPMKINPGAQRWPDQLLK